jgi:hypothetical protein
MIDTLLPIRQSSPMNNPAFPDPIEQPTPTEQLLPISRGPLEALIFVNDPIRVFFPILSQGLNSTSARRLILQPNLIK